MLSKIIQIRIEKISVQEKVLGIKVEIPENQVVKITVVEKIWLEEIVKQVRGCLDLKIMKFKSSLIKY